MTDFANHLRLLSAMAFTTNNLLYPCNTFFISDFQRSFVYFSGV